MARNKNICIVTWFATPNFGTNLQAFALSYILRKHGYSVRILSALPPSAGLIPYIYYWFSRSVFYRPWVWIRSIISMKFKDLYLYRYMNMKIEPWAKKALNPCVVYSRLGVKKIIDSTDCFVVGSDQVWNTYVGFDPTMFLSFACDKKRISYSSSLGTTGINPEFKHSMKNLLLKFSYISVRERASVSLINELLDRNSVINVVDPTLLLTKDEWLSFSSKFETKGKYIFCYLVGKNPCYKEQVVDEWKKSGVDRVVAISMWENGLFSFDGGETLVGVSPPEFVWLLNNASLVCTDSFHATALSINLGRPFVELLRFDDKDVASQNSRIYDILDRYNLKSRLYNKNSTCWLKEIDYSSAHKLLECDRKKSLDWLLNSIEN